MTTPDNALPMLEKPQFPRALRGYDPSAVDAWMDKAIATLSRANSDLDWSRRNAELLQRQLDASAEASSQRPTVRLSPEAQERLGISGNNPEVASVSDFLLRAERFANEMLANAKADAEKEINAARQRAEEMVAEVRSRVEETRRERLREVDRIVLERQAQADAIASLTEDVRASFESWRQTAIAWLNETTKELSSLSPLAPAPVRLEEINAGSASTALPPSEGAELELEAAPPPPPGYSLVAAWSLPSRGEEDDEGGTESPRDLSIPDEEVAVDRDALVSPPPLDGYSSTMARPMSRRDEGDDETVVQFPYASVSNRDVVADGDALAPLPPDGYTLATVPSPWTPSALVPPPPDGYVIEEDANAEQNRFGDDGMAFQSRNGSPR